MLLAVRISSCGCTWEVWKALKKLELLSAAPRATLTHFPCSPNLPHASITRYTHAKHKHIRKLCKQDSPLLTREVVSIDPLTSRSD